MTIMTTGMYTPAHAARLLGMHSSRVRRWLGAGNASAVVAGRAPQPLVGFHDLVELLMIRDLVEDHGIKLGVVRQAVKEAAARTGLAHPLAAGKLHVYGRDLFLKLGDREEHILTLAAGGQLNFAEMIERRLQQLEFVEGVGAVRWHPVEGVTVQPEIGFGDAVVDSTGLPTETVYNMYLAEDEDTARVAELFDLTQDQVNHAVEFQRRLAA